MQLYYFDDQSGKVKIGKTKNVERRLNDMRCANPFIQCAATEANGFIEKTRHRQFAAERTKGEWFEKSERLSNLIDFLNAIARIEASLRPQQRSRDNREQLWKSMLSDVVL